MPSAWTQNFYHTVFSTKNREDLISPELEERLYPFMGGIARDLKCSLLTIGGVSNHVHLLLRYPPDLSHSDMLRHIKSRSSKWIHETLPELRGFSWQEGYGGFTVSKSGVAKVEEYIASQKKHHHSWTFEEEVAELMRVNEMEYDPVEFFR